MTFERMRFCGIVHSVRSSENEVRKPQISVNVVPISHLLNADKSKNELKPFPRLEMKNKA